jgi:hypothetical protein
MNPQLNYWLMLLTKMMLSAWLVVSVLAGNCLLYMGYQVIANSASFSYTPPEPAYEFPVKKGR